MQNQTLDTERNLPLQLSVVIQAGGESRRMGQDKALVPFLGQTLIERVIGRVISIADEVLVTSNQPESLAFLHIPTYPDLLPGRGSLSGLYTALSIATFPLVAVVACDMAFVNAPLLAAQRDHLIERGVDGVVPQTTQGCEPFHAVYRRDPCREAVRAAMDAGRKRADSWFHMVRMDYFLPEQIARYDPVGEAFINLNTPTELKQAEAQILTAPGRKPGAGDPQ